MALGVQPGQQSGLCIRQIHRRHRNLGESQLLRPVQPLGAPPLLLQRVGIVLDHTPIVESSTGLPEPASWSRTLVWADEAATAAFAHGLAQQAELLNAVVALRGELGAGKTTLVRHVLRALGVTGRIKSPTYAVVEPYNLPLRAGQSAQHAWHFDFYRFSDPREWEDAGFRDLFAPSDWCSICGRWYSPRSSGWHRCRRAAPANPAISTAWCWTCTPARSPIRWKR
ncbi:MAG: tRNA (adenosine(37)-N6)-threonylcarbamoyltransferase complex ATPase subunit type 1 TsaE [Betaproteobacteria bacterium]|nr:tRNA (adenosine(37)-N6)-threonylcarbamoyltransferase complex ATPase subunit type 1 TsaE [Betaproteobacteria bacterium]